MDKSKVVAVIQARMGSSRLPGKACLPLGGKYAVEQVLDRVKLSDEVDEVVIATSTEKQDDIIEKLLSDGSNIFRGSEEDVQSRMFKASEKFNADTVVRITGDCPLISPKIIDAVIEKLHDEELDYCTNVLERTFPRGFDVEAFTFESFKTVKDESSQDYHREHVTPYYTENEEKFEISGVTSSEVFDETQLRNRADLRLTLDEADDYILLKRIFEEFDSEVLNDEGKLIKNIDERKDLKDINKEVKQKEV